MRHVDPHAFFVHPALSVLGIIVKIRRIFMSGSGWAERSFVCPQLVSIMHRKYGEKLKI
jgi:hypothetical protein